MSNRLSKLNLQRPLRFPLRPIDQLFFLHIPETAGTRLTDILAHHITVDEWLSLTETRLTPEKMAERLTEARLIHGHHDYRLKFSMRRPVVITFLRQPCKRAFSNYQHLNNAERQHIYLRMSELDPEHDVEQNISLEYYLRVPDSYNKQTRMIGGFDSDEMKSLSENVLLQTTQAHLEMMPFFGIEERFDDSIRLLNYVFGWANNASAPQLNIKPESQQHVIPPEAETALEETNRLDTALYKIAEDLFEARFQQMLRETSERV
jgi:hypothetical protein